MKQVIITKCRNGGNIFLPKTYSVFHSVKEAKDYARKELNANTINYKLFVNKKLKTEMVNF